MRPGDEFAGRYVLKEVIGTGRGGEVWLAHDTVVGQDVALKRERVEGERETAVRRLLGEPRALAKFRDHPHVVTLFDVLTVPPDGDGNRSGNGNEDRNGEEDGGGDAAEAYWFVMEHVPGGGLDRHPPMSPVRAARVGAQLADALAALHRAGIVHCDVKPANVGLTGRGTAKLLDFGAAYRAGGTETITANGPYSFTPDYAAPELARGNVPRPASDVFCLAATLHALVTGSPPRGGDDGEGAGEDTARLTHWKAEQGVVELDAEAVGPLRPVLAAMLRRDPAQRPDAAEAGRLLAAVAESGTQVPGGRPAEPGGGRRRRRVLFAGALGLCAALALGLVALPGGDAGDGTGTGTRDSVGRQLPEDPGKGGTRSLIGDPRTADVCALTDPAALDRFGRSEVDVDYGNFDRCDVLVHTDDSTRIDVSLQLRRGAPPEASEPVRTIGSIAVREQPAEPDECGLLLSRDAGDGQDGDAGDGMYVGVRVDVGHGEVAGGAAALCAVADTAARSAAGVLNRGPLPRRSPGYPAASLAWADACALLDARALSVVPGVKADVPEAGVANWECEWFSDVDDLEADIAFFRDEPRSARDGRTVELSGYQAVVEPEGNGADTCTVFVAYRAYGGRDAETAMEMVRLYVGGQRPMGQLCGMATDLAASAAARLRAR
ncbi:serine/threonine-protein kinase [Streptomyces sp. Go-475]|uniref:serine/threonine-protein kinase n=1 Tax=Streptomyces sp. Go-475 TaxID=2072505 RepID=UPI000DEEA7D7|nr:serine/threonine-protein kinase [Streptomyces sp. Go-475]AXE89280.1 Serine/threonine-protein kinase StkP [Streptomyces sp. Go-475]